MRQGMQQRMQKWNAEAECRSGIQKWNAEVERRSGMQKWNAEVECRSGTQKWNAEVECRMQKWNAECRSGMQKWNAEVECRSGTQWKNRGDLIYCQRQTLIQDNRCKTMKMTMTFRNPRNHSHRLLGVSRNVVNSVQFSSLSLSLSHTSITLCVPCCFCPSVFLSAYLALPLPFLSVANFKIDVFHGNQCHA